MNMFVLFSCKSGKIAYIHPSLFTTYRHKNTILEFVFCYGMLISYVLVVLAKHLVLYIQLNRRPVPHLQPLSCRSTSAVSLSNVRKIYRLSSCSASLLPSDLTQYSLKFLGREIYVCKRLAISPRECAQLSIWVTFR